MTEKTSVIVPIASRAIAVCWSLFVATTIENRKMAHLGSPNILHEPSSLPSLGREFRCVTGTQGIAPPVFQRCGAVGRVTLFVSVTSAMPFKANTPIRHKFWKSKHRVTNWAAYTESFRLGGDLTLWFDHDMLPRWRAIAAGKMGRLDDLFRCRNRDFPAPGFSTRSHRAKSLDVQTAASATARPISLIVNSTGPRLNGRKYGLRKDGKTWRHDQVSCRGSDRTIQTIHWSTPAPTQICHSKR